MFNTRESHMSYGSSISLVGDTLVETRVRCISSRYDYHEEEVVVNECKVGASESIMRGQSCPFKPKEYMPMEVCIDGVWKSIDVQLYDLDDFEYIND